MGQTGLDVIGDAPTMSMIDADHPYSKYTAGTQGVSLSTLQDYTDLLDGVPLDNISLSASLPPAFAVSGIYLASQENGYDPSKLRGSTIQLFLYAEDCCYAPMMPFGLRRRLASDSVAFAAREMPKFHALLEDTYYISDGGLNAVEEMALGFVEIRYLVRDLLSKGHDIDTFAPRIAILLKADMDFFETVAKVRATRRLFATMMKEEYGAKDPRSMAVNITSHTSGVALTAQQPINNVVRGASQALSLVMAGVQSLEISTFDEAYRTPSEKAHEVALRTQQVISLETNVSNVQDPLGGSYYVEHLTAELERAIRKKIDEIEAAGDPGELADKGYFRSIFVNAMERYSHQVESGEIRKVGVNAFQIPQEDDTLLRDEAGGKIEPCAEHIASVEEFKQRRDQTKLLEGLRQLHDAGKEESVNILDSIITCYRANASVGEMAGVLREAYGHPYDPLNATQSPLSGI